MINQAKRTFNRHTFPSSTIKNEKYQIQNKKSAFVLFLLHELMIFSLKIHQEIFMPFSCFFIYLFSFDFFKFLLPIFLDCCYICGAKKYMLKKIFIFYATRKYICFVFEIYNLNYLQLFLPFGAIFYLKYTVTCGFQSKSISYWVFL